jgi:hypothetical protein
MTEQEWRACTDPGPLLEFLQGKVGSRRLRLFAVACCRRVWHLLTDERSRRTVEVAERFADGLASPEELLPAAQGAAGPVASAVSPDAELAARATAARAAEACYQAADWPPDWAQGILAFQAHANEKAAQVALLRCIGGNPFRSVVLDRVWLTPAVVAIAQAAYDERELPGGTLDNARLAVLADALEDAGCTAPELLAHLRSVGAHVRGCFAVDLILGRS